MVRKGTCCIGICNNDRRYPEKSERKSDVQILKWHRFQKDKVKRKWWQTLLSKRRVNFIALDQCRRCSNHFVDGKPIEKYPNPTLLLTNHDNKQSILVFCSFNSFFFSDQKTLPSISHTHQPTV